MCVCGCSRACDKVYVCVFACMFHPLHPHIDAHTLMCVCVGVPVHVKKCMYVCVCMRSSPFLALAQHLTCVRVGVCVYASVWKSKGACVCMRMHDSVNSNLRHEIRKYISE